MKPRKLQGRGFQREPGCRAFLPELLEHEIRSWGPLNTDPPIRSSSGFDFMLPLFRLSAPETLNPLPFRR